MPAANGAARAAPIVGPRAAAHDPQHIVARAEIFPFPLIRQVGIYEFRFEPILAPKTARPFPEVAWEWTRSLWGKDKDKADLDHRFAADDPKSEDLKASNDVLRLVRGGSWLNSRGGAHCAVCDRTPPDSRRDVLGFRLMLRSVPVLDSEL